ncbi:helix-hairpin-helix domain-containing protein [Gulosibacter sp. 10]|uniref:helix-hairpin-helix domain-containing protein n=1 Tax=Gulosibacter sp. 10 TaxID=1255570 RepID=UPI00097EA9A5|nr:helix-hairpin-helix domain-containing protein [Gulosibacter sp. 10]SJM70497.1 ComEA protein-related protein [Gulosibacter sp. 10]
MNDIKAPEGEPDPDIEDLFSASQRPRWKLGAGAAVVLALVACAVVVLMMALRPQSSGVPALADPAATPTVLAESGSADPAPTPEGVLVHVLGAVEHPGVYELGPGARVVDAIGAAGGLTAEADSSQVNLARPAVDGEQIYVPEAGETPPAQEHPAEPGAQPPSDPGGGALVNLNTASASELETLPRIGPAMSQRIIDYREANGGFSSVEELMEVSGIGDAIFEQLRDLVTV